MKLFKAVLLLCTSAALGGKVTPVEKVITLLKALKMQVQGQGKEEAASYDKFACFCKDTTTDKSKSITDGQDKIDTLTADIETDTASKEEKDEELLERKTKQEELDKELEEVTARCAAEMMEFEAKMQELMKAVTQLGKAVGALKASKSFLQVRDQVESSLALADALGFIQEPKEQRVSAFIQGGVDPDDPEYKFHSDDIVTLLEKLETEFKTKKDETQKDWDAAKKECEDLKKGLKDEMKTNEDAMKVLEADILKLKTKIAKDKADLVLAEDALKDDTQYLKDLQFRCEDRAKDWDQRTQSRNDEVNAITEALSILQDGKPGEYRSVKDLDESANERALLVQAKNKTSKTSSAKAAVSLMQLAQSSSHRQSIRLHRSTGSQEKAANLLQSEGARLQSSMLSELAKRIHADPFAKVKMLIQQLLQRLLTEAAQEATKKGFCDTELGKAEQNRDTRFAEIKKMAAEHQALKAEKIRLEDEIVELKDTIADLKSGLKNATDDRATEKAENMKKIKDAKEGLLAIADAIKILKDYYKDGAKKGGAKLVQLSSEASPVDEDTDGAGFKGAYRGNAEAGGGVIAVLEVIESDFDRTVRHTTAAEKEALAAFVKLDRSMKVDIETKSTHLAQDEQDLKNTEDAKAQKLTDIEDSQNLLDDAVKAIEDLKPMCIDTTMSYEDRKKKREDEIEALKKAMCLLDPDKVDAAVHGSPC